MSVLTRPSLPVDRDPQPDAMGSVKQRLFLRDVTWQNYKHIGQIFADRPNLRITYDRGNLEFMTISNEHEFYKKILSRLLETLLDECGIDFYSAGSMTFQRDDLRRGLEPDDCFWITHESVMRGRFDYDPDKDPPPDLVLEIEVSDNVLNRLDIYSALRVPEIWRFDGQALSIFCRQDDGGYLEGKESQIFRGFPVQNLVDFAKPDRNKPSTQLLREFREWIAQNKSQQN